MDSSMQKHYLNTWRWFDWRPALVHTGPTLTPHSPQVGIDNNQYGFFKEFAFGEFRGNLTEDKQHAIFGRTTMYNGDVYNGHMFKDKREGIGTYAYSNGDIYNGMWHNDKKDG